MWSPAEPARAVRVRGAAQQGAAGGPVALGGGRRARRAAVPRRARRAAARGVHAARHARPRHRRDLRALGACH